MAKPILNTCLNCGKLFISRGSDKDDYCSLKCKEELQFEENVYERKDREDFVIADYDDAPLETVICKRCGSDEFIVGNAFCVTAIKCKKCKWQRVIHDG